MFGNMFAFKGSFQAEVRTRSRGRNPPPSRSPARPPRPQRERTRCCVSDDVVARSRAPPRVRPAESGDDASNTSCASVSSQRVLFLTSSPICSPNAPGHRRRERERRVGHSSLPQGRDVFRSHQRGTSPGRAADTARPNRSRNHARRMRRNHEKGSRAWLNPGAARVSAGVRSPDTHTRLHGLNPKNLNWRESRAKCRAEWRLVFLPEAI